MKHLRIIASVSFLTLFGIMSLHNIVPHMHHSYADDQIASHHHDQGEHSHHHHHEHDQNEDKSEDNGLEDILLLLFGDHSHTFEIQHVDTELTNVKAQNIPLLAISVSVEEFAFKYSEDNHRYYLFKPRIATSSFYSSRSLRAPPVLG